MIRVYKTFIILISLVVISSCSDNRVLTQKFCKTEEQTKICNEGCEDTNFQYSRFTVKEGTVLFVSTYKGDDIDIVKLENCKIIDKNNWQCGYDKMIDGLLFFQSIYTCAK